MLELSFFQIKNSREPLTQVSADLTFADGFYERSKDLLYEVKNAHVEGQLFYDEPFVTGNFQVEADLLVPSSRSLEAVPLHQKFSFVENYSDHEPTQEEKELGLMIIPLADDRIDVQTAVEDNILLNIPTTILTEQEATEGLYPEGQGWEVVSEQDFAEQKKDQVNPAFAQLQDLLDKMQADENEEK
ncbi:DUF177 domain-containing protein [Lactobacillus nasalidis]|uniref:DUF177 domain-containing protein n=1 Tax=Lactobacillus nasalidis TaxID=2797258 RepID=UPI0019165BB4|nr:DUF177 domain-containing protein [Lactobacillus nasalidis]GHV97437.1 DNA-binding protein [Lactobacillus nasalidis]GHV98900.1 DNA-binding protein [Lactobacillus nasalidis]